MSEPRPCWWGSPLRQWRTSWWSRCLLPQTVSPIQCSIAHSSPRLEAVAKISFQGEQLSPSSNLHCPTPPKRPNLLLTAGQWLVHSWNLYHPTSYLDCVQGGDRSNLPMSLSADLINHIAIRTVIGMPYLWYGRKFPIQFREQDGIPKRGSGGSWVWCRITAGFDDCDRHIFVFGKPICQYEARSAASHNDVVEWFGRGHCNNKSLCLGDWNDGELGLWLRWSVQACVYRDRRRRSVRRPFIWNSSQHPSLRPNTFPCQIQPCW